MIPAGLIPNLAAGAFGVAIGAALVCALYELRIGREWYRFLSEALPAGCRAYYASMQRDLANGAHVDIEDRALAAAVDVIGTQLQKKSRRRA